MLCFRMVVDHEAAAALAFKASWSLLASYTLLSLVGREFGFLDFGIVAGVTFGFILLRDA